MKNGTDVLELLTTQHTEVDGLIEKIKQASERKAKTALFTEMADKLAAHAAIEEQLFYPAVFTKDTEDKLREAAEEHLAIKRVLADMLMLDPMDKQFDAKLSVLTEQLTHHAHEEEEKELFPQVRTSMPAEDRAALGGEMLSLFEELLATHPSKNVPSETKRAVRVD